MSPKELRSRRLALHLTTAALASHLGRPAETIDAWERGEQPIDDDAAVTQILDAIEKGRPPSRNER